VGIIDCGFDFSHINFLNQNGSSRVKAVYLPLDTTSTPPIVNLVRLPGSAYETPSEIASLTTDDNASTHGTLTAGLAAGGYRDNGWYGMAPEADIVMCGMPEGELNDVRVANCISYIMDYARRKMKPCVISMSLCSNVGSHDGTSYLNRLCEQVTGAGRIIVASAGNDGAYNVTAHRSIANSNDTVFTLLNGFRGATEYTGYVNARSIAKKPFNTRLIVVNTITGEVLYRSRAIGATSTGVVANLSTETDSVLARYFTGDVEIIGSIESNGKPNSMSRLNMLAKSDNYCLGFQYFSPSTNELAIFTSKYAYIDSYGFSWALKGSSVGSISDIATTDSVISVGSYNSRQTVPLRDGSTYFRPNSKPGYLSSFSSFGPDENGISRPDICAPGSVLVSSANRYFVNPPNLQYWQPSAWVNGVEYTYSPDLGTSMSAPIVAGTIALWLQANPSLSVNDVRDILKYSARQDEYVKPADRQRWGAGKLDAYAGLLHVLKLDEIVGDVNGDREVNIADINVVISIIQGEEVSADFLRRADVNKDDEVNISDVNRIIEIILNS
jgi:subtilisin family serine protease